MRPNQNRLILLVGIGILIIAVLFSIGNLRKSKPSVLQPSGNGTTAPVSLPAALPQAGKTTVPWDYKIDEAKVGDLIGGDMTILPDYQLLSNDDNYATGDKVWVLSYIYAEMETKAGNRNDVSLSAWKPIKSYHTQEAAQKDMENLKLQVTSEVDLIGVYKTELEGKNRQFAILNLPSGHTIKQPVTEERYNALKNKKQVKVQLEEVHDYSNYDLAMAKFRGWAE